MQRIGFTPSGVSRKKRIWTAWMLICAVYTEEAYRNQGIAGNLLNMTVNDLSQKGITPVYLVTDHVDFHERYGWEFLCMVQGDDEPEMSRMYIHR